MSQYKHTHTYIYNHACTHTRMHAHTHTYARTHIHTHTHIVFGDPVSIHWLKNMIVVQMTYSITTQGDPFITCVGVTCNAVSSASLPEGYLQFMSASSRGIYPVSFLCVFCAFFRRGAGLCRGFFVCRCVFVHVCGIFFGFGLIFVYVCMSAVSHSQQNPVMVSCRCCGC